MGAISGQLRAIASGLRHQSQELIGHFESWIPKAKLQAGVSPWATRFSGRMDSEMARVYRIHVYLNEMASIVEAWADKAEQAESVLGRLIDIVDDVMDGADDVLDGVRESAERELEQARGVLVSFTS